MHMKFRTQLLFALFIFAATVAVAQAQPQPHATHIKTRALAMARLLLAGNYTDYVGYMHPRLRSSQEEQQQIRAAMDSVEKYRKQYGIKVSKVLIGNPTPVVQQGKVLQSALVQTTTIQSVMGSITTENVWIALSEDGGATWYFAEAGSYEMLRAGKGLPQLSRQLQIPTVKAPVITPAADVPQLQ